jgi:hypothetical protein
MSQSCETQTDSNVDVLVVGCFAVSMPAVAVAVRNVVSAAVPAKSLQFCVIKRHVSLRYNYSV